MAYIYAGGTSLAHITNVSHNLITVVETNEFQRLAAKCMSNDERNAFILYIAQNPEAGDIMVGTGGVRKVRWGVGSRGKSGGVRVIYFYHNQYIPIFLLTVFAKNEKANLSQGERNELKRLTDILIETYPVRTRHEQSRRKHHRRS
jgi:hypothetical protein